jgi:hypothetical protein
MDTQFLTAIIPPNEGWFYITRIVEPKSPDGRVSHKAIPALRPEQGDSFAAKHNPTNGIFFTPFTFNVDYIVNDKGENRNARKSPANYLTCKTLWLDIDCGEGKDYPDQKTALRALFEACDTGMPKPTYLVNSGGGIHAWWVLDECLPLAEWKTLAARFKAWWKASPLRFDHVCTEDAARFMRLPGTNNMKQDDPRPVRRLDYHGAILPTAQAEKWPVSTVETLVGLFASNGEDMGHHDVQSQFFTAEISKKCEVFKRVAATGGADCAEPLWRDILQTVELTEDADEWAHTMSKGHADYSAEGVEVKRKTLTLGKAILCATYADHFEDNPCDGCILECQGKSPLGMGHKDRVPVVPVVRLMHQPYNVERRSDGLYISAPPKKGDGPNEVKKISGSDFQMFEAVELEENGAIVPMAKVITATGGAVRTGVLRLDKMFSTREAATEFGAQAIATDRPDDLRYVIVSWFNELKEQGYGLRAYPVNGWAEDSHGLIGFSHGPTLFKTDGTTDTSHNLTEGKSHRSFAPRGDAAVWKDAAVQILSDGRPELAIILASSFAAPLVKLLAGGRPAALSFYSASGSGKSTALKIAAGVWCTPTATANTDASLPAVTNILAHEPSMPLYWDELRGEDERAAAVSMMFQVVQGTTRQKATQHGTNRAVMSLHTLMVVASNESFTSAVSSGEKGSAEGKRMLEFRLGHAPKAIDDNAIEAVNENYGAIGHEYAAYLATHVPELKKRLTSTRARLRTLISEATDDRLYLNLATVLVTGAEIANELGFVDIDIDTMILRLHAGVLSTKAAVVDAQADTLPAEVIKSYLGHANGLTLKRFSTKAMPLVDSDIVDRPTRPPTGPYVWHWVLDKSSGTVRVSRSEFKRWFTRAFNKNLNWTSWLHEAQVGGILVKARTTCNMGGPDPMHFVGSERVNCMVLQLPELATNPLKARTIQSETSASSDASSLPQ